MAMEGTPPPNSCQRGPPRCPCSLGAEISGENLPEGMLSPPSDPTWSQRLRGHFELELGWNPAPRSAAQPGASPGGLGVGRVGEAGSGQGGLEGRGGEGGVRAPGTWGRAAGPAWRPHLESVRFEAQATPGSARRPRLRARSCANAVRSLHTGPFVRRLSRPPAAAPNPNSCRSICLRRIHRPEGKHRERRRVRLICQIPPPPQGPRVPAGAPQPRCHGAPQTPRSAPAPGSCRGFSGSWGRHVGKPFPVGGWGVPAACCLLPGGDERPQRPARVPAVPTRWDGRTPGGGRTSAAQPGFRPRLVAGSVGTGSREQAVLLGFAQSGINESPTEKIHTHLTSPLCKGIPRRQGPVLPGCKDAFLF